MEKSLFRALHIFHLIWIHCLKVVHFKPRALKRCWIRTSSLVEGRPWFCSSEPIGGYATRPKSSGICCRCPYGCAPNACGCWRRAWSSSRGPRECLASSRPTSWCGALCFRWRNGPGQLRASHGGWFLKYNGFAMRSSACKTSSRPLTDLWRCHSLLSQLLDLFLDIIGVQFQPRWDRPTVGQGGLGNTFAEKLQEIYFLYEYKNVGTRFRGGKFSQSICAQETALQPPISIYFNAPAG